jgi:hypothetical protein
MTDSEATPEDALAAQAVDAVRELPGVVDIYPTRALTRLRRALVHGPTDASELLAVGTSANLTHVTISIGIAADAAAQELAATVRDTLRAVLGLSERDRVTVRISRVIE